MSNNNEINSQRLKDLWESANSFGLNKQTNGINRCGYTTEDTEARNWLIGELKSYGFTVTVDGVNNVIGRLGPAQGPTICSTSEAPCEVSIPTLVPLVVNF